MRTTVAESMLTIDLDGGDAVCVRPSAETLRLGELSSRRARRGLRTVLAGDEGATLVLSAGGQAIYRIDLDGVAWQVDGDAVLAAGSGVNLSRGRAGFYPRGHGRLILADGKGPVWLVTGGPAKPVRIAVGGRANRFVAAAILAFEDTLDSRCRRETRRRYTASFTGEGAVLVSSGRAV